MRGSVPPVSCILVLPAYNLQCPSFPQNYACGIDPSLPQYIHGKHSFAMKYKLNQDANSKKKQGIVLIG
jgi:hypothetical protein